MEPKRVASSPLLPDEAEVVPKIELALSSCLSVSGDVDVNRTPTSSHEPCSIAGVATMRAPKLFDAMCPTAPHNHLEVFRNRGFTNSCRRKELH
jgi:hypothetical protein